MTMAKKIHRSFISILIIIMAISSCDNYQSKKQSNDQDTSKKGTFGYDLHFLREHDDSLIVLANDSDKAKVIVSAKYQAKVFTSTADGNNGLSFGWVNYKAFSGMPDAHMNAYGGENRFWLGPEGGKYSLFFKPGDSMVFANWKTPAAFDMESWGVTARTHQSVTLKKDMNLLNYKGTNLEVGVERTIKILPNTEIEKRTGLIIDSSVKAVGYQTDNVITNLGKTAWTATTGMPCIWMLDMFTPSPSTVVAIPFKNLAQESFSKIATTNYFGEIASDRLKHTSNMLFFRADGKSRGKLGIIPTYAKPIAASYDQKNKILTIILFDIDSSAKYLNQEWNTTKPTFSGDAVNSYNDGPLANGTEMGPFFEIESVSPAAFLKPGQSLSHKHSVFHFTGNEKELNAISLKLIGVSLNEIEKEF